MDQLEKIRSKKEIFEEEDYLKDCPNGQFVPTTLPAVPRIIAIGDIHGDLNLAIRSFKLAKLIDDNHNWIAEPRNTVVVQVGDQIDSCRPIQGKVDCHNKKYDWDKPEDMSVINFFDKIDVRARKHGGAVYSLLGNHELMNFQGRFSYVSYANWHDFYYLDPLTNIEYKGKRGRKKLFEKNGYLAKRFACTRPSVLVIGSTMFVHAGILPSLTKRLEYIGFDPQTQLYYLNRLVRKWLLNKLSEINNPRDTELKQIIIDPPSTMANDSPFWNRVFGQIPVNTKLDDDKCSDAVKKTLEVYKIGQLVVGHTPQSFTNHNGINGTCYTIDKNNPSLFRVDGGFSEAFGVFGIKHPIQVLEIIDDKEFRILTEGDVNSKSNPSNIPSLFDFFR